MPFTRLSQAAAAIAGAAILSVAAHAQDVCVANSTGQAVELGDYAPTSLAAPVVEDGAGGVAAPVPVVAQALPYDPAAWATEATTVLTAPAGERTCVASPARFGGASLQVAVGCARWGGYTAALNVTQNGVRTPRGRLPLLATVGVDTVAVQWPEVVGDGEVLRDIIVSVRNAQGPCERQ